MRILVTGASGFIGRRFVSLLQSQGDEPFAVSQRPDHGLSCPVVVTADALDADFHQAVIEERYRSSGQLSGSECCAFRPRNPHAHRCQCCLPRGAGAGRQAGRSTSLCADRIERRICAAAGTEADRRERSAGAGKALWCDQGCRLAASADHRPSSGLAICSAEALQYLRSGEKEHRLLPSLARALSGGKPAALSPGTQVRDFLYVDEACEAIRQVVHSLRNKGLLSSGEFHLASGEGVTVREFALTVSEVMNARPELLRFGEVPMRPDDLPYVVAATAKLDGLIGPARRRPLAQAIEESLLEMRCDGST